MTTTWQDRLISLHPRLFRTIVDGREYVHGHAAVGDGWRQIVETAVGRIVKAAGGFSVRIVQVKSKDATLRMYWQSDTFPSDRVFDGIDEAIALAEARSACTCEVCGVEGRLHASGGRLATSCSDHARGEPVPVHAGWENLHIVRNHSPESPRIITCRRYVRQTDSFVDVSPLALGIEE
jgi:hypothetical protein